MNAPSSNPASTPEIIACVDPATGESLGSVPALDAAAVRECIERARKAQVSWGATGFGERRKVLRRLSQLILDDIDGIVDMVSRCSGKTRHHALIGDIWPVLEKIRWTVDAGERALQGRVEAPGPLPNKIARVEYVPLGVMGIICPWNFPLQNVVGPAIPALFAGNAVVAKTSEWVAASTRAVGELLQQALVDCGHARDLVQVITGGAATGAALIAEGSDKIFFTGSVETGRKVMEKASQTLTPVVLELGGKDPMLVCDDVDLDRVVASACSGCFLNSGQMCMATERILVPDVIHDEFVRKAVATVQRCKQGPPLGEDHVDMGALTMPAQVDMVHALVSEAIRDGAKLEAGGVRPPKGSQFYPPTILSGVTPAMRIAREETFGPVMAIIKVRDDEHALEIANATSFGLSSSVHTRDRERARSLARRLVAGSTCVNDIGIAYLIQGLPFGGVRDSGFGRMNGAEGLRACTNEKAIVEERFAPPINPTLLPARSDDYALTRTALEMRYSAKPSTKAKHALDLGRKLLHRRRTAKESSPR